MVLASRENVVEVTADGLPLAVRLVDDRRIDADDPGQRRRRRLRWSAALIRRCRVYWRAVNTACATLRATSWTIRTTESVICG